MSTHHRNPVNLLRALAVLLVVAHHYQHYFEWRIPYAGTYGGLLGVQLFFLISGYLIVDAAGRRSVGGFLVNRAFRIFPAYWVAVLAASWYAGHVFPVASRDIGYFLVNLLALGHLSPHALVKFDVLTVSWTLTIEWSWYLMAAAIAWPLRRGLIDQAAARRYWLTCIACLAIISSTWVLTASRGLLDAWYANAIAKIGISPINDHMRTAFILAAAPAQWVFFGIGLGLRVFQDRVSALSPWLCLAVGVVILAWPPIWALGIRLDPGFVTGLGLAGLFVWCVADPLKLSGAAPARWLHRLGDWSYPLYLVHVPVMLGLKHHFKVGGAWGLLSGLLACLLVSWVLHVLVENPGRRLGQRLQS